ncbi:MAG: hypothetical protein U0174_16530 [Polyangiaceae bacterium]
MFFATSSIEVGPSRMELWLGVSRHARVYAAERKGLCADTLLLPAARCAARDVSILWFFLDGETTFEHESGATCMKAPSVAIIPEHWREGANGKRDVRIRMGMNSASVQVLFRARCDTIQHLDAGAEVLAEVASMHREVIGADEGRGFLLLRGILRRLVAHGLVPPSVLADEDSTLYTSAAYVRLWNAMRQRIASFDVNPSLKSIAADANMSGRHAQRLAHALFEECLMPPGGFREATINLRLSLASILLSKSSLSVVDVARLVGYLNPETLTSAFRHTGLPSPVEIRRTHRDDLSFALA